MLKPSFATVSAGYRSPGVVKVSARDFLSGHRAQIVDVLALVIDDDYDCHVVLREI